MSSRSRSWHCIAETELLSTLICNPVASPKPSIILISVATSCRSGLRNTAASSAYRERRSRACRPRSGERIPSLVAIARSRWIVSMASMKRYDERGLPCRSPLLCLIFGPEIPFKMTEEEEDDRRESQLLHWWLNPLCCSSSMMYSQDTVSNAFAISNLNSRAGVPVFLFCGRPLPSF